MQLDSIIATVRPYIHSLHESNVMLFFEFKRLDGKRETGDEATSRINAGQFSLFVWQFSSFLKDQYCCWQ